MEKEGKFTSTDSRVKSQLSKVILATKDNLCKPKENHRSFKIQNLALKAVEYIDF